MTDQEAFEAWAESAGYRPDYLRPTEGEVRDGIRDVQEAWHAALAYLRDENESLRGSLEEWKLDFTHLRDMIDLGLVKSQHNDLCNLREELRTLRDENAKLRRELENNAAVREE